MDFLEEHQGVANALKYLVGVVVIVGVLAALGLSRSAAVTVKIEDDVFSIYYKEETVVQFSKDEIRSAEIVSTFAMGDALEVISEDKYEVGTWENDDWGQYTLCIKKSVDSYIVVTTDDAVYVFNYESEASTESMCTALLEW